MAGHSKWANIRHRKGKEDAKRGMVFTKLIREITVSAKQSPDPQNNPRLRTAIDNALCKNMSKDTIQKAINKGAGLGDGVSLTEIVYEGYGPGGVAFLVECATDNKNRTVSDIRHAFTKAGGSLASTGAVSYLFKPVGLIEVGSVKDFDKLFEDALDFGAQDVEVEDDLAMIECEPPLTYQLSEQLKAKGYDVKNAQLSSIPQTQVEFEEELAEKIEVLFDKLEEHDDVQKVYCNFDFQD